MTLSNALRFIALTDAAVGIMNSQADWETKYDLIFSADLCGAITDTDIEFDWSDPDTTYEDDVRAYVTAIEFKAEQLRLALQ